MNETQIRERLKNCNVFKGVFPADLHCLPVIQEYPCGIISNTDPHYLAGQHWIVMYFNANKVVEYFDSYGRKPFIESHILYMNMNSNKIIYNNKQVQSIFSTTCGEHCIYYMIQKCCGYSAYKIMNSYSENYYENDNFVYSMIH